MAQAARARVMAGVESGVRTVLPGIIQRDPLFQVSQGSGPFASQNIARSKRVISFQEKPRVLRPPGQDEESLRQVLCWPWVVLTVPQSPQRGKKLRRFSHILAQLV